VEYLIKIKANEVLQDWLQKCTTALAFFIFLH